MRFLIRFLLLLLLLAAGAAGFGYHQAHAPLALPASPLEFSVPTGTSLRGVSQIIADGGVPMPPWQFTILARAAGQAASIKAGNYEIENGITPWQLLLKLTRGDVQQDELTLVEGRSFLQFRQLVEAHPSLRHDSRGLSDQELMARLQPEALPPEGQFFPDTYLFAKGTSDFTVYRRAFRMMQRHLGAEWASRAPNLPYQTPYQALIMASIVEKETGSPQDRPLVASVFVNRLRIGMLLQTDPTVIYGLGSSFDGNLRKRDLLADTPFNTYTRPGLPPTPIAMPGLASLKAALHPPRSEHFYFVARGDGTSQFSRTLDEHNRAVAKYQLHR